MPGGAEQADHAADLAVKDAATISVQSAARWRVGQHVDSDTLAALAAGGARRCGEGERAGRELARIQKGAEPIGGGGVIRQERIPGAKAHTGERLAVGRTHGDNNGAGYRCAGGRGANDKGGRPPFGRNQRQVEGMGSRRLDSVTRGILRPRDRDQGGLTGKEEAERGKRLYHQGDK